jgi:hypothetical protein
MKPPTNKRGAGKGGIPFLFHIARCRPALPERGSLGGSAH